MRSFQRIDALIEQAPIDQYSMPGRKVRAPLFNASSTGRYLSALVVATHVAFAGMAAATAAEIKKKSTDWLPRAPDALYSTDWIPAPPPPPPPVPLNTIKPLALFNGFYAGMHVGHSWNQTNDLGGTLGGVQGGYNYHLTPCWVIGVETDVSIADTSVIISGAKMSIDYYGTMRGRVGFAMDRFMVYGSGGLAYAHSNFNDLNWGWTMSAGIEAFLTQKISGRIEVLYFDFSDQFTGPINVNADSLVLRVGMNYKF